MNALLLLIVLIALNAMFAATEIAVISMNDVKLKNMAEDGDKRAKRLVTLTDQPTKFLSTIQVACRVRWLRTHLPIRSYRSWSKQV